MQNDLPFTFRSYFIAFQDYNEQLGKKLKQIIQSDDENLLVSNTGTGIIHQVNVKNKQYETFVVVDLKFGGPNGILLDLKNNRLIAVGYDPNGKAKGSIISIDLKSKKQKAKRIK